MVHCINNNNQKKTKNLIALVPRRVFQRSLHLSPSLCQEQFLKHTICHTKQPTYAYIQISLSRRKGGVSLVYPTSSCIWLRERKNPSSVWLLPLQPHGRPGLAPGDTLARSHSLSKGSFLVQKQWVQHGPQALLCPVGLVMGGEGRPERVEWAREEPAFSLPPRSLLPMRLGHFFVPQWSKIMTYKEKALVRLLQ